MSTEQYCRNKSEFSANFFLIAGNGTRGTHWQMQTRVALPWHYHQHWQSMSLLWQYLHSPSCHSPLLFPRKGAARRQCRRNGPQGVTGQPGTKAAHVRWKPPLKVCVQGCHGSFSSLVYEGNQIFNWSKPQPDAFLSKQNLTLWLVPPNSMKALVGHAMECEEYKECACQY